MVARDLECPARRLGEDEDAPARVGEAEDVDVTDGVELDDKALVRSLNVVPRNRVWPSGCGTGFA
jgi:hypothetical protein